MDTAITRCFKQIS